MSFGTFCAILFLMFIAYLFIAALKGIQPYALSPRRRGGKPSPRPP